MFQVTYTNNNWFLNKNQNKGFFSILNKNSCSDLMMKHIRFIKYLKSFNITAVNIHSPSFPLDFYLKPFSVYRLWNPLRLYLSFFKPTIKQGRLLLL